MNTPQRETSDRHGSHRPANVARAASRPRLAGLALACIAILGPGAAQADAVTDWNAIANEATAQPLPIKLRSMAMVQIAVHDALNAIVPRYERYSTMPDADLNALPEVAVARAARDVLLSVAPAGQHGMVVAAYDGLLATTPGCPSSVACQDGIAAGQAAAAAILANRAMDGSQASPHLPYTWAAAPGIYQATLNMPAPGVPAFANWANVRPFTIGDSHAFHDMFRAPPSSLLVLDSATYTGDYNQVKAFGAKPVRAASPSSSKSRIARFWYGSAGADWAGNVRRLVDGRGLDLWEHARLFALLAIGQADVTISVFEGKYHYVFWRPVTAIRWLDDGNDDTAPDPDWTPYLVTPPYPDYPCGTPMLAGAATEILRDFFNTDDQEWTAVSNFAGQPGVPAGQVTRSFHSFSGAADESAMARVYAGIHFGTGCHVGVEQGEQIARYAFDNLLKPR